MNAEAQLRAENATLRERVLTAERSTAQTLARATRLSQVVSVLGSDNAFEAVVAHAAREVAELFSADIGLLMLGAPDALSVRGTWGMRETDLPDGRFHVAGLQRPDVDGPVATGPASELPQPAWLVAYRPRHLAWVRLLVGAESLGFLLLVRRADQPFEQVDRHELSAIGYRIALALENGILHDQMRRQLLQLGRMHELTTRLSGEIEIDTVGELIAGTVVADVPATACRVEALRDGEASLIAQAGGVHDEADVEWTRHPLRNADRLVGSIDVAGGPAEDTDELEFLRHIISVAALALDKALLYERSRDQARKDSLTGLLGHRVFQEEMQRQLSLTQPLTVVRLDIDDFKRVNDLCGHQVGDDALRLVAQALRGAVRDGDQVFRVGGEEFCVILPGLPADSADAITIAERLRQRVADIQLPLPITVSLGLAGSPLHACERDKLLEQADIALYTSKHSGKNRVSLAGAESTHTDESRQQRSNHLSVLHRRDPETVVHSLHVSRLAVAVARQLGIDDDRLEDLRQAAELHDLGKIAIPDAILSKPGPLNDDEFRIVKTHPVVGAELLSSYGLGRVAEYVRAHHERIDGTGYPAGLRGQDIPLESRIIHAVDAYTAMTLDRPYRRALSSDDATDELLRHRGTQFDPSVVDALLTVEGLGTVTSAANATAGL